MGIDVEVRNLAQPVGGNHVHGFPVGCVNDRLTDLVIVQDFAGFIVDAHKLNIVGLHFIGRKLSRILDIRPVGERNRQVVDITVFQCDNCGGVVLDHYITDLLDLGCSLPVVFKCIQSPAAVGPISLRIHVIRTRAGQVSDGAEVAPLRGHFLLAQNFDFEERVKDRGIRTCNGDHNVGVVQSLHLFDHVRIAVVLGIVHKVLIAEHHVRGLQGLAIVELHAVLQRNRIHCGIIADIDLLCQAGLISAAALIQSIKALINLLVYSKDIRLIGICRVSGLHTQGIPQHHGISGSICCLSTAGCVATAAKRCKTYYDCKDVRKRLFHFDSPFFVVSVRICVSVPYIRTLILHKASVFVKVFLAVLLIFSARAQYILGSWLKRAWSRPL